MSAAYRTSTGATVVRSLILALAALLFVTQVLAIATNTDAWNARPDGLKVTLVINCLSYLVLAGIAGVALAARRFETDLLLLAAGGWSVAWAFSTGPAGFPYLIEFGGDDVGIEWTDWTSAILGLFLALVSVGQLFTILAGARGTGPGAGGGSVARTSGASSAAPTSSVPPGWHTDPGGAPGKERWWDGSTWTDHLRDAR